GLGARGPAGLVEPALDPGALGLEDVVERLLQLVEESVELMVLEETLALAPEPLEGIAEPGHLPALAGPKASAPQSLEGTPRIAVGHQVVGHGGEQIVGVEVGPGLGAVPARVPDQHGRSARGEPGTPTGSGVSRILEPSAVVAEPAGRPVLVQLPVEVKTLQDELDGGGDARRLAAPTDGVERAAKPAQALGVRGIVLG